jgi:hypothetical protein
VDPITVPATVQNRRKLREFDDVSIRSLPYLSVERTV